MTSFWIIIGLLLVASCLATAAILAALVVSSRRAQDSEGSPEVATPASHQVAASTFAKEEVTAPAGDELEHPQPNVTASSSYSSSAFPVFRADR